MNASAIVGTFLKPDSDVVRRFVSELVKNCGIDQCDDFICMHNAISLYTMQMLTFATGHRAVTDPFCYLSAFDLKNNLVLIEDKVASSNHQARITWLPPLAINQLQNYLVHLSNLARVIHQENPRLANEILSIQFSPATPSMPLFFYLTRNNDEILWSRYQPSAIKTVLGELWILPLNSNRHILSTWLREHGCNPEIVDAQLGHIEAGCAPFGKRSVLEPGSVAKTIIPFLQAYLDSQGWVEVKGIKISNRIPIIRFDSAMIGKKNTVPFGAQIRSINRQKLWQQDAKAVTELVISEFGPECLNPGKGREFALSYLKATDRLRDRVIREAPSGRVLVRLAFLKRHLVRLKLAGWEVKVPGRLVLGKSEDSSFDLNSSKDSQKIERVRKQFINYLSSRVGKSAEQERRVAEIFISAVLYGANTSLKFIEALGKGFENHIFRTKDHVYVDITTSENGPIRRWIPDDLSLALILGYLRSTDKNTDTISETLFCQYLLDILKFIDAPFPRTNAKNQTVIKLLEPLIKVAESFWRFRLPGVLQGYAEGDVPCASVPLSNWIRLVTGSAGTIEQQSASVPQAVQAISYDDVYAIQKLDATKITYKQAKECWRKITAILGGTNTSKNSDDGKIHSGSNESRSSVRKNTIVSKITRFLEDESGKIPPIAALVAAWICHLCSHGTSHGGVLRVNSVTAYARSIGDRLIALAYQHDFFSIPDVLIEDIYRNLLDTASAQNRSYVAARLKEFHSFLISTYAMPDLDWSEILDGDLQELDAVDAGIVTLDQYQKALEVLSSYPEFSERDRLLHSVILFLAYRFGLRTGEIFRLTISDILLNGREMVVFIRNSIYGETKSDNGIRQLPLIGGCSDLEFFLISRWLDHVEEFADGDDLATLLPKPASRRETIDRSISVRRVLDVLRSVTGDQQTRLRHLRHTCATRLFLAMILDDLPSGLIGNIYRMLWGDAMPKAVRQELIGTSSLSRRGLYAMALYMGHASPDVTHRHYVHLADIALHEWLGQHPLDIDNKALSYVYQTTYENVRKLKSRCETECFESFLIAHYIKSAEIQSPSLCLEDMLKINLQTQKQLLPGPVEIDRILSLATLRNSYDAIEGIADRFLTTDHVITSILKYAVDIQEQTGFDDFAIPDFNPNDNWVIKKLERYELLEKESVRVRAFLSKINEDFLSQEQLKKMVDIWIEAYHPISTALLIRKRSELAVLLDGFKLLGIQHQDFEVIIPHAKYENQSIAWSKVEAELVLSGLKVSYQDRLPLGSSKQYAENRLGLILRASDSHGLGYQRTLNRVLFVIAVWIMSIESPRLQ